MRKLKLFSNLKAKNGMIYMDYASGAPVRRSVAKAMRGAEKDLFANPSSIHSFGVEAKEALNVARTRIARAMEVHTDEIIFTSGGTESDNLALFGVVRHACTLPTYKNKQVHIIVSAIEHPAILEAAKVLESEGVQVTYLPVREDGRVDPQAVREALTPETVIVSIMHANNEIGTVQPIREIAKIIRHFKNEQGSDYPFFHTDACQTAGYFTLKPQQLGVDLLSFNGTKIGGPRGSGALFVRHTVALAPHSVGGGQERGFRSGTENVLADVGLAEAFVSAQHEAEKESQRLTVLRDLFTQEIEKQIPDARINGSRVERLPNNVHVSVPHIDSELLVIELDAKGIAASAGSACASTKDEASHVLEALYGNTDERSQWGSVRFSLGATTSAKDVRFAINALRTILKKYERFVQ